MPDSLYFLIGAVLGLIAGCLIHSRLMAAKLFLYGHAFDEVHQLGYYVDKDGHLKPPLRGLPIFGEYADEAVAGLLTLHELGYEWKGGQLWVPPLEKTTTFDGSADVSILKGQAQAWEAVYETLHEVKPDMRDMVGTGTQVACQAIRQLASDAERYRSELRNMEYMTGKS